MSEEVEVQNDARESKIKQLGDESSSKVPAEEMSDCEPSSVAENKAASPSNSVESSFAVVDECTEDIANDDLHEKSSISEEVNVENESLISHNSTEPLDVKIGSSKRKSKKKSVKKQKISKGKTSGDHLSKDSLKMPAAVNEVVDSKTSKTSNSSKTSRHSSSLKKKHVDDQSSTNSLSTSKHLSETATSGSSRRPSSSKRKASTEQTSTNISANSEETTASTLSSTKRKALDDKYSNIYSDSSDSEDVSSSSLSKQDSSPKRKVFNDQPSTNSVSSLTNSYEADESNSREHLNSPKSKVSDDQPPANTSNTLTNTNDALPSTSSKRLKSAKRKVQASSSSHSHETNANTSLKRSSSKSKVTPAISKAASDPSSMSSSNISSNSDETSANHSSKPKSLNHQPSTSSASTSTSPNKMSTSVSARQSVPSKPKAVNKQLSASSSVTSTFSSTLAKMDEIYKRQSLKRNASLKRKAEIRATDMAASPLKKKKKGSLKIIIGKKNEESKVEIETANPSSPLLKKSASRKKIDKTKLEKQHKSPKSKVRKDPPVTPHSSNSPVDIDNSIANGSEKLTDSPKKPAVKTPMLTDPRLPLGWSRKVCQRKSGKSAGHYDVYILSPTGKKFRSHNELARHIADTNSDLQPEDFDFSISGKSGQRSSILTKRKLKSIVSNLKSVSTELLTPTTSKANKKNSKNFIGLNKRIKIKQKVSDKSKNENKNEKGSLPNGKKPNRLSSRRNGSVCKIDDNLYRCSGKIDNLYKCFGCDDASCEMPVVVLDYPPKPLTLRVKEGISSL